jgi:myo-inositol-1(or 4)-monophosphatase
VSLGQAVALFGKAGAELHYLNGTPFPLREFSVKSARVQYVAGNAAVCAKLRSILAG